MIRKAGTCTSLRQKPLITILMEKWALFQQHCISGYKARPPTGSRCWCVCLATIERLHASPGTPKWRVPFQKATGANLLLSKNLSCLRMCGNTSQRRRPPLVLCTPQSSQRLSSAGWILDWLGCSSTERHRDDGLWDWWRLQLSLCLPSLPLTNSSRAGKGQRAGLSWGSQNARTQRRTKEKIEGGKKNTRAREPGLRSLQTPRSSELIGSDGLLISQLTAPATSDCMRLHTHNSTHSHTRTNCTHILTTMKYRHK